MNFDAMTDCLNHFVDDIHIPTVDMQVFHKGNKVYDFRKGKKDGVSDIKITDYYNLYSVSKVITCTAAMQLFEKGKFILTDPLYEYLPEFKDMYVRVDESKDLGSEVSQGVEVKYGEDGENLVKAKNPIRIRDVFNMTAGFDYNTNSSAIQRIRKEKNGEFLTSDIIKALSETPLLFEPGTKWSYSLGHDLLAAFVEKLSGMKFSEYLKQNIFEPLGMDSFTFERTPEIEENMVDQFRYNYDTKYAEKISKECSRFIIGKGYESGGAGLAGTPEDYGKFVNAMSMGGVSKSGERILSECTINLMKCDFLPECARYSYDWTQLVGGYGYGLGVRTHIDKSKSGGLSPLGEFGWGGAAGAYVLIDNENQIAAYYAQHMLNNLEPYVHPRLRNLIYSCIFG